MKKAKPTVSVIIPIYNVESYLERCINSVVLQTCSDVEVLLIDDGSTDCSGQIADEYAKKFESVKVIHKKNSGLSSARNVGIENSRGDFLIFVDSDDYIESDFIARLFELIIKYDADIATCKFVSFTDDDSRLKSMSDWPNAIYSGHEAVMDMLRKIRPAYIWLSMYRKSLFTKNKIKFPNGHEYEDIATKVMLLHYARKVVFTNEELYLYLIRKEGITGKPFSERRYSDFLKALNDVNDFLARNGDENETMFLDYFRFCSLRTLINYLAREKTSNKETNGYWKSIYKEMKLAYKKAIFPSFKARIAGRLLLILALSRKSYSILYRRIKQ